MTTLGLAGELLELVPISRVTQSCKKMFELLSAALSQANLLSFFFFSPGAELKLGSENLLKISLKTIIKFTVSFLPLLPVVVG